MFSESDLALGISSTTLMIMTILCQNTEMPEINGGAFWA
jgi:hypothetical protein